MYLGNISCLAGTILMIAAPGNFVRSVETGEEAYSLLWRMYLRCYAEAKELWSICSLPCCLRYLH